MTLHSMLLFMLIFFGIVAAPFSILQPILLIRNRNLRKYRHRPPVPGRRIMVLITTVGKASSVVNHIIDVTRSYGFDVDIRVLIEDYDHSHYNADTIVVPESYQTGRNSQNKHRALHYFSQWLKDNGYGPETYVIHLDDDTYVTGEYIQHVFSMVEHAGLGTVRLREYGHSLFSTLADFGRITDYDSYVSFFSHRHRPIGVNGEGLTIRADIESELGWDFGPVAAEDLVMGQRIFAAGYSFGYIPGYVMIAPATTAMDFYRQRRRWVDHFFRSARDVWKLRKAAVLWFGYLYLFGWGTLTGLIIWALVIFVGYNPPVPVLIILTYELIMAFMSKQYGAWTVKEKRYRLIMLIMQIPVAMFESGTFFYWVLARPKGNKDYTIAKV